MFNGIPWLSIDQTVNILDAFVGGVGRFVGTVLGVSGELVIQIGLFSLRTFDIVMLLMIGGLSFFFNYYKDALKALEKKRDERVKAMYTYGR